MKICSPLFSIFFFLFSNSLFLFSNNSNAQGCSDAGVCTMGAPHLYTGDSTQASSLEPSVLNYKLSQSIGLGEQSTIHLLSVAELNWKISDALYAQVKLPYLFNIGNLATTHGLGDVSLSATIVKRINSYSAFNSIVGFKIPLNNSNQKIDAKPLPMPYQTSLGTFDGILGFVYQYKNWNFTTAYQKVLISNNENSFLANSADWINNADANKYFASYNFVRGDDAILKAERNFMLNKKWSAVPSVLAIYRVNKDRVKDSLSKVESDLPNSDGLTLNVIGNASYQLKNNKAIDLSIAFPLIVRQVRADGLTRSLIASVSYKF
jgi:hypothetical protein